MTQNWRITAHEGLAGLRELDADWHRLTDAMPDRAFIHLYETNVGFCKHMPSAHGPITYLALRDGDGPGATVRAIFPIEPNIHSILGVKVRSWALPAGGGDLPRDIVCPPDPEARIKLLPMVRKHLRQNSGGRRWLVFERILETSVAWQCLPTLRRRSYCPDVAGAVAYIDADAPYTDALARLTRHFRQNLRTARNRLATHASVRFENATDAQRIAIAFDQFLDVEGSGWKGVSGTRTAVALKPGLLAFHRELVDTLARDGDCVEISTLHVEGRCIGAQFCIRTGADYAVLKTGFDQNYSRVDPGHLMLADVLERSCADTGIRHLNMVSNATWLGAWQPREVPTQNVYVGLAWWASVVTWLLALRFKHGPRVKRALFRIRDLVRKGRGESSSARGRVGGADIAGPDAKAR